MSNCILLIDMEIETTILTIPGMISAIIMSIAVYYGISLKARIPKELAALNLIIYALLLMVVQRVFHIVAHSETFGLLEFVDDATSLMIAILMLLAFKRMFSKLKGENHPSYKNNVN